MPMISLTATLDIHFEIRDRLSPEDYKGAMDCLMEAIEKIQELGACTVKALEISTLPLASQYGAERRVAPCLAPSPPSTPCVAPGSPAGRTAPAS